MKTLSEHWNKIFGKTDENKLGWYETNFTQTLKFLHLIPDWRDSKIFVPGVGTSGLIDILINSETELILNDLSSEAIEKAKSKYKSQKHNIQWLCQDISKELPINVFDIDIWLDRAVLHFLTTDKEVEFYVRNVNKAVKIGGYAFFAEFSKTGATKCAGLNVRRYDINDLKRNLPSFELVKSEEFTYINPVGSERPYVYALFKRIEK